MDYSSYELIHKLLAAEKQRTRQAWHSATELFSSATGKTFEDAYAKVQEQFRRLDQASAELRELVREHYAAHPDEQVRKFWLGQ